MPADRAYIQRIAALGEFASRINQFDTNNRGVRTEISSAVNAGIGKLLGMQSRMESRRAMAAAALASAKDAYRRCMDYHSDDENSDSNCCSFEAGEVDRLETVLENIEECCSAARQLVMEAQTHGDNIESMVSMLNGSIDVLCSGASGAL
ncbi:MAG: hypothetical protein LBB62_09995, partial [Proteiniphilum sp.]|nr:hypothetical protein [Proteiniphilum sp.]